MSVADPTVGASQAPSGSASYLIPLLLAPVAYRLCLAVVPGRTLLGWDLAVLSLLVAFAVTIALWLPYRTVRTWPLLMRLWLLAVVLLWIYLVVISQVHDGDGHWAALVVPVGLLLIYVRPPARGDVWRAGDVLAWSLLATGLLQLSLEVIGVVPSWYQALGGQFLELSAYDRGAHWLPLGAALGLEGRWGGILQDPNLIGPLGVLLAVYGFARHRWTRVGIVVGGLIMVLLVDSRASYGALAIGLVVLALLPGWPPRSWLGFRGAAVLVAVLSLVRLGANLSSDPIGTVNMSGRSDMWPSFLALLGESPLTGVGTSGIVAAHDAGLLPVWTFHAHNQYLDGLVRYGWIGAVLMAVMLILLAALAVLAAWRRTALPIALLTAWVVVAAANVIVDWRYPDALLSMLLVAALIAATQDASDEASPERRDESLRSTERVE